MEESSEKGTEDKRVSPKNLFGTPPAGRVSEEKSSMLLPLPTQVPDFAKYVVSILQRVVKNNDTAVEYGVTEFLRQFRITNEAGLSLLTDADIPNGPEDSIWSTPVFRKAFLAVCTGCADIKLSQYTSFSSLRSRAFGLSNDNEIMSVKSVKSDGGEANKKFSLKAIQ